MMLFFISNHKLYYICLYQVSNFMEKQTSEAQRNNQLFEFSCIVVNQSAPPGKKDIRKQVINPNQNSPYKFIGKTLAYFTDDMTNEEPVQGTAFFIGKNLLLTCAHNVSDFQNRPAKKIYFYPAQNMTQKMIILEVNQYQKSENYEFSPKKQYGPNIYDLALLELEQNNLFSSPQDYLQIKSDFDFQNNKKAIVLAAGYPNEKNGDNESCYLYQEQSTVLYRDGHYFYYNHFTTGGQSGMPLFEKVNENKYNLIGIHKGVLQGYEIDQVSNKKKLNQKAFGHFFGKAKMELTAEYAQKMKVEKNLGRNYKPSYQKLQKQIEELKNKINPIKKIVQSQEYDTKYVNRLIDQKQFQKAFDLANKAVQKQCYAAYGDLSRIYADKDDKNIVKINYQKSYELALKGAEYGYANAQFILGKCYNIGLGVEKNIQKAVELYTKAAEQGNTFAQCNLAICYKNGDGVEKNIQKAVELYTEAAEQGNEYAQYNLGYCYHNIEEIENNIKKAVELFTKAAEQGHANAQYNLGVCYYNGKGVEKNIKKAVELFTKAAEQGHAGAQQCLAICYFNGKGVEKNIKKAVELYTKAAKQKNAYAQNKLKQFQILA